MLKIESNGSTWAGSEPKPLGILYWLLESQPLDSKFEDYGDFVMPALRAKDNLPIYPEAPTALLFWGNFANVSHVFRIATDEPEMIATLTAAIRANQSSDAYASTKVEALAAHEKWMGIVASSKRNAAEAYRR